MGDVNKEYVRLRLATCFRTILKKKKLVALKNKANDIEDLSLVGSIRQLEAESGLSYTIVQGALVGKRDIQFTTLITMIESLGISFSEFAKIYDKLFEKQISEAKIEIEIKRRRKHKEKK